MSNKTHFIALVFVGLLISTASAKDFVYTSAELSKEMSNIVPLVNQGDYAQAQTLTQKLIADFSKDPELPKALSDIADRYRWADKYEEAKTIYRQIIQDYPDSPIAADARFGLARMDVLSSIWLWKFDDAKAAFDKMVTDFSNHPDFPEELYWTARKYGWSEMHEEEKAIYQQVVEKYPDSPYAVKASLGAARANVQSLILSKDYEGAQKAVDKMVVDFANNPYLHDALYWIAERDEWAGRCENAKSLYQQIIQNYPDSSSAGKAKFGLSRVNAQSLIISGEYDSAEEAVDKLIADFAGHPDLPKAVMFIGEQCYKQGLAEGKQGLTEQAKIRYGKAAEIWENLQDKFPESSLIPEVCGWTGDCYIKLGKYEESIRCFQKVVDSYPEYKHAGHAQYMVGRGYEELKNTGVLEESIADTHIKDAYEKVVLNYPDCPAITYVNSWLSREAEAEKEK